MLCLIAPQPLHSYWVTASHWHAGNDKQAEGNANLKSGEEMLSNVLINMEEQAHVVIAIPQEGADSDMPQRLGGTHQQQQSPADFHESTDDTDRPRSGSQTSSDAGAAFPQGIFGVQKASADATGGFGTQNPDTNAKPSPGGVGIQKPGTEAKQSLGGLGVQKAGSETKQRQGDAGVLKAATEAELLHPDHVQVLPHDASVQQSGRKTVYITVTPQGGIRISSSNVQFSVRPDPGKADK